MRYLFVFLLAMLIATPAFAVWPVANGWSNRASARTGSPSEITLGGGESASDFSPHVLCNAEKCKLVLGGAGTYEVYELFGPSHTTDADYQTTGVSLSSGRVFLTRGYYKLFAVTPGAGSARVEAE